LSDETSRPTRIDRLALCIALFALVQASDLRMEVVHGEDWLENAAWHEVARATIRVLIGIGAFVVAVYELAIRPFRRPR
jgi:hypothetical protein